MLKLRSLAERGVDVCVAAFPAAMSHVAAPPGIKADRLPAVGGGRKALAGLAGELLRGPRGTRVLLRSWRRGLPLRFWPLQLHLARLRPDIVHIEWLSAASRCLPLLQRWDGPVIVGSQSSELLRGGWLSVAEPDPLEPHCAVKSRRRDPR